MSIHGNHEIWVKFNTEEELNHLLSDIEISYIVEYDIESISYYAKFLNSNALDLLSIIFESDLHYILKNDKNQYNNIYLEYLKLSGGYKHFNYVPNLKCIKLYENAILPHKARASDAGYDLTIISKVKQYTNNTWLYGTGLKIQIPAGYYAEIVGRSSISKTGYMVSNNVGVIDLAYTGELFVALTKVSDVDDIELPYRIGQLILKPFQHYTIEEVKEFDSDTKRGSGGFGSTG